CLYPKAFAIVGQSQNAKRWLEKRFPGTKTYVIPNPVDPTLAKVPPSSSNGNSGGTKIVSAAGRLSHEKGFDILLKAYARIAAKFDDWRLEIFGEGPLKTALMELSETLKLKDKVVFRGQV